MIKTPLTNNKVKYIGRLFISGTKLWMTQSGSGFAFRFKGKRLDIILGCDEESFHEGLNCNMPRIAVTVNGRFRIKKLITTTSERYTLISSEEETEAVVSIIKLSEAAFSLAYAEAETDDNDSISPLPAYPVRIGFIGDSITCGYGVDDSNAQSDFSTEAQNALKSYACTSAGILGAEYSLFSYSGYGIISGWTADGIRNTREVLPPYYEHFCHSYKTADGTDLDALTWDNSSMPADIIVVNLGTNDNSFCTHNPESFPEFEETYFTFLKTVNRCHPEAFIIASIGIIEVSHELSDCIHRAADRFRKEVNDRIAEFRFTGQNGDLGFGSQWHPSEDTQAYAAEELADFIRSLHVI